MAVSNNTTFSIAFAPTSAGVKNASITVNNNDGTHGAYVLNLTGDGTNLAINTYTLTYTHDANGSISGNATQTVNYNTSGTPVSAVPNTGYHFLSWSDASTANPRTDTGVTANITVLASFAINTYTLTYNAGANGSISGTSPQTVNYNSSGTPVSAVPNGGYHFVNWSDASTANPRTDTGVTANITVTANFAITTAPTVTTDAVSSITTTAAAGIGTVTDDGGSVIIERGIVWNTGGSPTTTSSSKATSHGTTGDYTASITGLTAGSLYHVRAYAINAMGISYGNELTFTTLAPGPTVATATGMGNASFVTSNGTITGLTAIAEGSLPTAGKPNLTFPFGLFSFNITGLTAGQTVNVTITLPSTVPLVTQYWKYQAGSGWKQIPMVNPGNNNVITITLVDGGLGDADGKPDGTIVDPGGPGAPPVPVPGVSQWGIVVLAVLLGGTMVWVLRRRLVSGGTR